MTTNAVLASLPPRMSFPTTLDRLVVGSILRSKLVFLNHIQLQEVCFA
jgi:hypothetical protein